MKSSLNITKPKDYLDTWTFSAKEWHLFTREATSLKKEDNIYMAIATLIVGIPFLMLNRRTTILMSLFFVIPFAVLIPYVRYKMALNKLKLSADKGIVEFYSDYILINGKKVDIIRQQ